MGVSQESLDEHFAGPAFLPWQRMGNMEGWGGPLSSRWHEFSVALQHRILQRMRALGMTPVLPAFAGHVPKAVTALFPESSFSRLQWSAAFNATFLLEPVDPLFQRIADTFMKEYIAEFGTDHVYNCDTFNEMDPKTNATEYLSAAGAAIFRGMTRVDPKAVWIMQGWLFLSDFWRNAQVEAIVTSVPKGSMIVLDLDSTNAEQFTRTGSYFGQPFIFNDLNNFGGNQLLFGRLGTINSRLFAARSMANSTMIGTGFTPEGLSDTYAATDLLTEMAWRRRPVRDVSKWLSAYAARRYGQRSDSAEAAWATLARGVLNATVWFPIGGTFITSLPKMNMSNYVWYPLEDVVNALENLVKASDQLFDKAGFRYTILKFPFFLEISLHFS
jgi:alpha-N-acetylglucosaminidase